MTQAKRLSRRVLAVLLSLALTLSLLPVLGTTALAVDIWDGSASYGWYTEHTDGEDYIIATASDLAGFANIVNNKQAISEAGVVTGINPEIPADDFSGKTVILIDDIDLGAAIGGGGWSASGNAWTPIGSYSSSGEHASGSGNGEFGRPFKGTFDGQFHTISNLYVPGDFTSGNNDALDNSHGLFGDLGRDGTVQNIIVASGYVRGDRFTGGIVGRNWGHVENVINYANVETDGSRSGGGITGVNYNNGDSWSPSVKNSVNYGGVHTGDKGNPGGITGDNEGVVENSLNLSSDLYHKTNQTSYPAGGVIGNRASAKQSVINSYTIAPFPVWAYGSSGLVDALSGAKTADELTDPAFAATLGSTFVADYGNNNGGYPILLGYALANGWPTEAPGGSGAISYSAVTFTVTPANAVVTLTAAGAAATAELTSSASGSYTFKVETGGSYNYSVSANGYTAKSGGYLVVIDALTIPVALTLTGGGANSGGSGQTASISGGSVIISGGVYNISQGASGTITVATSEPVTLVGLGTAESDSKFSDLTVDCAAGANLTVRDLWIWNNFGQGTSSGETNPGQHILNFTGRGNTLNLEGVNLFENLDYVKGAGIHVGKGSDLAFYGSGSLYLYKYSEGAGIGGDANEASGALTFAGGHIFIKGSKTGPLVGGDAGSQSGSSSVNDDIFITGGELVLINKANGAAIGTSHKGTSAGDVYLRGGNLTIISDWAGSAIGYGGSRSGSPGNLIVSGGSFKAVRTANSLGGGEAEQVNDSLVTAEKRSGDGKPVRLLVFNTGLLKSQASAFTVSGAGFSYSGGLHNYRYTDDRDSTIANFGSGNDKNLYFYLTESKQTLTVNGEKFTVEWKDNAFTVVKDSSVDTTTGTGSGGGTPQVEVVDIVDVKTPLGSFDNGKVTTIVETAEIEKATEAALKSVEDAKADGKSSIVAEVKVTVTADTSGTAAAQNISETTAEIKAGAIRTISDAQDLVLTVESEIATVTLDNRTLAELVRGVENTETITVSVSIVDKNETLSEAQRGKAGDNPVVEANVLIGTTQIHNFGGTVTVSVPYTVPVALKAEDYELLTVYYLDDDGNLTEIKGAKYDPVSGLITFATNHFSKFVLTEWINPFTDVQKGVWYYKAVRYGYSNDLLAGTTTATFSPGAKLTSAMVYTLLAQQAGVDVSGGENWYAKALDWAVESGISDGANPTTDITREQLVTVLYKNAGAPAVSADLSKYTDANAISAEAQAALEWAVATGLITGNTALALKPQGTATRAELAVLLQKSLTA